MKELTLECLNEITAANETLQLTENAANVTANVGTYLAPMDLDDDELNELVDKIIRAITAGEARGQ